MTRSEIFYAAHAIARETREAFVTYRAAFSAALKGVYATAAGMSCQSPAAPAGEMRKELMFILHVEEYYSNAPCALERTEWFDSVEEALHYAEYYKDMNKVHVFIEDFKTHEIIKEIQNYRNV